MRTDDGGMDVSIIMLLVYWIDTQFKVKKVRILIKSYHSWMLRSKRNDFLAIIVWRLQIFFDESIKS